VTLLEIIMVTGLLVVLFAFVVPNLFGRYEKQQLLESAQRLRAQIQMVRTQAQADNLRYRIRWVTEEDTNEDDLLKWPREPFIEYEPEPFITEWDKWSPADSAAVQQESLIEPVRCLAVTLGKPTAYETFDERFGGVDFNQAMDRAEVVFNPDGTCEWATFTLTDDRRNHRGELNIVDVIVDGRTGQVWIQQPLTDKELEQLRLGSATDKLVPFLRQDHIRGAKPLEEIVRDRQAAREEFLRTGKKPEEE
jgi:type II secretory pathway pseudopilin PulG